MANEAWDAPTTEQQSWDEFLEKVLASAVVWARKFGQSASDAEDTAQRVGLTLWERAGQLQDVDNLRAWAFTVTRNLVFDSARKTVSRANRRDEVGRVRKPNHLCSPREVAATREAASELRSVIGRLSRYERRLVEMRYYRALTCRTIAERVGRPTGTVERHLTEVRKKIRAELHAEKLRGNWRRRSSPW